MIRRSVHKVCYFVVRRYFQLFHARRLQRPVLENVAGAPLLILPGVFNPRLFFTGEFLARNLNEQTIPRGSRVLDLGTGSGVAAVFASKWASKVVALDINPEAIRCARINVCLNRIEDRVEVRQGDLFSSLDGEVFDVILFNPPYFRGEAKTLLEGAFRSPDVDSRFAASLRDHMSPGGVAFLVLSSMGEERAFLNQLKARGFQYRRVAEETRSLEVYRIYQVHFASEAL